MQMLIPWIGDRWWGIYYILCTAFGQGDYLAKVSAVVVHRWRQAEKYPRAPLHLN